MSKDPHASMLVAATLLGVGTNEAVISARSTYSFKLQMSLYSILGNVLSPQRTEILAGMREMQ